MHIVTTDGCQVTMAERGRGSKKALLQLSQSLREQADSLQKIATTEEQSPSRQLGAASAVSTPGLRPAAVSTKGKGIIILLCRPLCHYSAANIICRYVHVDKLKRAREVGKSLKRTKKVSLYRDSGEIQVATLLKINGYFNNGLVTGVASMLGPF